MKYAHIVACATLGFFAVGCKPQAPTYHGDTNYTVDSAEEVANDLPSYKIATVSTYPPFATTDEKGVLTGFDIDILKAIAHVEQFNAVFIDTPWDAWQTDLSSGKVDIWAAGITIKDKRKEVATYSNAYMNYETAIFTLDKPEFIGINEKTANKYILGAEANSTSFEIANSLQPNSEKTISYPATFNAFQALLQGKVEAVVGNNLVLGNLATDYPDFKYKMEALSEETTAKKELGFLVKKDRNELEQMLNDGLDKIKANGTYDQIKIRWFGDL